MATLQSAIPAQLALNRISPPLRAPVLPRLGVVIVNYRQWENTAALVKQIRSAPETRKGEVEVMVVDNHSPPHPFPRRLRRWSGVSLRRWGRNRGFARAANEGCRLSQGPWLLLLNPDVSVTPEFIRGVLALADRLEKAEPRAGIVGFQLQTGEGKEQLSAGPFPTLPSTLARLALPRHRRKYQAYSCKERCRVPWVTGCCLLIRAECWRDLGGFDENYFLYYEDVDLCRRARAKGWSVWFEPNLQAIHHNPLHGRPVSPALRLVTRHSLLTYGARHWTGWQFRILAGIIQWEGLARQLGAWWRGDQQAAKIFKEMTSLAGDLAHANSQSARKRLERVVRRFL